MDVISLHDEICWIFSNLMVDTGSISSIALIIGHTLIIQKAINISMPTPRQALDIVWGISNFTKYCSLKQAKYLVSNQHLLEFFCNILCQISGKEMILLETIYRLVELYADERDDLISEIESHCLYDKIDDLSTGSKNPEISELATKLLDCFENNSIDLENAV
jgi:hypothetical protein